MLSQRFFRAGQNVFLNLPELWCVHLTRQGYNSNMNEKPRLSLVASLRRNRSENLHRQLGTTPLSPHRRDFISKGGIRASVVPFLSNPFLLKCKTSQWKCFAEAVTGFKN